MYSIADENLRSLGEMYAALFESDLELEDRREELEAAADQIEEQKFYRYLLQGIDGDE